MMHLTSSFAKSCLAVLPGEADQLEKGDLKNVQARDLAEQIKQFLYALEVFFSLIPLLLP